MGNSGNDPEKQEPEGRGDTSSKAGVCSDWREVCLGGKDTRREVK